ncbi:MAG: extracellular solute-binding protein, partial [Clostridiaceae bacterium]|nr:extracellular solute-binding protein [Clostridiaceae bacterium]
MRLKSKIFITLIVICCITALMTGCVTTKTTEQQGSDKQEMETSKEEKKNFNETGYPIVNEKITVKSVYSNHPYYGNAEEMSLWTTLEEITNIHIDWEKYESGQFELYFVSGEMPDFFMNGINAEEVYKYGIEGGLFYDFNDYLEYMPNLRKIFEKYPTAEKAIIQDNGAIYTLPKISRSSTSSRTRPEYRTDYVEKVGVKPPETADEFYNVAKAVLDAGLTGGYAPLIPQD